MNGELDWSSGWIMRPDHRAHRLYVEASLREGADVVLSPEQSHYLDRVMRAKMGDVVIAFNNHEGEWRGHIAETGRKAVTLHLDQALRPPAPQGRVSYFFAPLKQARLDYMVQKAVEMGVARLGAVMTQHTMVSRFNLERMQANAIEAAEQCTMIAVPEVLPEQKLEAMLANRPADDILVFCDEAAPVSSPLQALSTIGADRPISVLIGPEGGFSDAERGLLLAQPNVIVLSLGPRIMRADTAAVAALAFVQAVCGDIT